jgi:twinkle protein
MDVQAMASSLIRPINPAALQALEARGLDPELILHCELYTARLANSTDGRFTPPIADETGRVLCFPYRWRGREPNTKFRWNEKQADGSIKRRFIQVPGAEKLLYNADVLDDPALAEGREALVICEGEGDCLSIMQAGYPFVVSVPDGAPADKDAHGRPLPMKPDAEIDPNHDPKFEYLQTHWDSLKRVRKIVLWTDSDGPGQRLRDELARRLDRVRCWHVPPVQPDACVVPGSQTGASDDGRSDGEPVKRPVKDANEVLVHFGPVAINEAIRNARPIAIPGLYSLDDFMEEERKTYRTGFDALDPLMTFYDGAFRVVTGLAGSGKSAVALQLLFNAAWLYGRRSVIASFEAPIKPDVQQQLRGFFIQKPKWRFDEPEGKPILNWTKAEMNDADDFIREYFCFVTRDPSGSRLERCTVRWVLDRFEDAMVRFGVRHALFDPWNKADHQREPGERSDEYLQRALTEVIDFAQRTRIDTTVVTHPNADAGRKGEGGEPMSLYNIQDGSHWPNAAEQGLVVFRKTRAETVTRLFVRKIKFADTGQDGSCLLQFDKAERRFVTSFGDNGPEP